jgi:hypothetical protein
MSRMAQQVYPASLPDVPKKCTESISTLCAVCPKMVINQHPSMDGRTASHCGNKHWIAGDHYNCIYTE